MSERIVKLLIESFPKILLPGLKMTIPLTVIAFSIAMVIAVIAAMIQYARVPVLRQIMRFYVWVVRGTPLLVQLFVVFYGLPSLGIILDPFPAAVIVFSINEGAYCAETMRAALESVPVGQMEAGYCVGMSYLQVMRQLAEEGMTMLVVTHEMNFARHVSNRVVFMEGGRIIEQNSAQEFFAHPKEARTQEFLAKINQR